VCVVLRVQYSHTVLVCVYPSLESMYKYSEYSGTSHRSISYSIVVRGAHSTLAVTTHDVTTEFESDLCTGAQPPATRPIRRGLSRLLVLALLLVLWKRWKGNVQDWSTCTVHSIYGREHDFCYTHVRLNRHSVPEFSDGGPLESQSCLVAFLNFGTSRGYQ
jgi:hypothetical protein